MLYLAHFDFNENTGKDESHGYFTCVVEAENIDEALEKFETLLMEIRAKEDILADIDEVYLNVCVEIHSVPKAGFVANYTSYSGAQTASISTSIRGASEKQCVTYSYEPDEEGEVEPFLTFTE